MLAVSAENSGAFKLIDARCLFSLTFLVVKWILEKSLFSSF